MSNKIIQSLLEDHKFKLKKCSILCIGDMILDHYISGKINRMSPEAPIPILDIESDIYELGGVGNVARNITSFGSKATVLYLSGKDNASKKINELLIQNKNIKTINIKNSDYIMPHKTRYISKSNHLLRVDREFLEFRLTKNVSNKIINKVKKIIKNFDLIILSDYSKGVLNKNMIKKIINIAHEHSKIIIADPKKIDLSCYAKIDILTPNQKEITDSSKKKFLNEKQLTKYGLKVIQKFGIKSLLITRSEKGMLLINANYIKKIKSSASKVYDVTGAGDTVVAILGLMIAVGISEEKSALIANYIAGIVIGKKGTSVTNYNEVVSKK